VHLSSRSTPSELATHLLWTADTGATAYMTPHKHWLRGYSPLRIPIRLANEQVVYSEGVGSVVFAPECRGTRLYPVFYSDFLLFLLLLLSPLEAFLTFAQSKHPTQHLTMYALLSFFLTPITDYSIETASHNPHQIT
jgi:hypothetical protein